MIETMAFGKTGHESTRTIFGAAAFMRVDQRTADRTLDVLLEHGINHIDVAASYGGAEDRLGPWMKQHRDKFFLATKTGERTYRKARDQIKQSLKRMKVPYVDLIQLHNLTDPAEQEVALGSDGALKAAIEARDAGLVRYIGVTGHGVIAPSIHMRSLERFPFDSVLLPFNYPMLMNEAYKRDFYALLSMCHERNVAVQTIKAITLAPWEERPHDAATWYEPLRDESEIDTAVHWVLGQRGVFLNTVGDVELLPKVIDAAARFDGARPADTDMQALVERRGMAPLFV